MGSMQCSVRRSTFFYMTYINSVRTSQETQNLTLILGYRSWDTALPVGFLHPTQRQTRTAVPQPINHYDDLKGCVTEKHVGHCVERNTG
jgi:hypothetical protein